VVIEHHFCHPTELRCDECGKRIGWTYECDNQSDFLCDECEKTVEEFLALSQMQVPKSWLTDS
jgi:hypothetical protein